MKFYVCHDLNDQVFDCVTTLSEAKQIVRDAGCGEVSMIDVPVNSETIRLLLGNLGGYATNTKIYVVD